jgi:hypothetical protein
VVGLGLGGNAAGTALVAALGTRVDRRVGLIITALMAGLGLVALSLARDTVELALAALFGMVNGMGRDRGPAQTLDQSLLTTAAQGSDHARLFTRYALVQDVTGGIGSLAAATPALFPGLPAVTVIRWTLAALGGLSVIPALLYLALPSDDLRARPDTRAGPPDPEVRRRVLRLASLFALDSLGGGFLAGSVLTFWFFKRFDVGGEILGPVFFAARGFNAASYLVAAWLANRIGLLRTMVFTHIPSSFLLLALPFVERPWLAILLFLARECLVQMDVPTRAAYVTTVTRPEERTFALGVTGLSRNLGWAAGPTLAGFTATAWGLGAPLFAGAGLKIVYDLALYRSFRATES